MNVTIRRFLSLIVFFSVLAAPLLAAPQAPVELRVSDTPGWSGAYDEPVGLSPHLHFRVRHLTTGAASPAVKLKVQLSTDSGFSEVLWDSGFVAIASTANLSLTPAIPYTGPALLPGATYMWRAAVQDDQNIPSAYSEVAAFEVAASGTCADLRVTTGVGSEEIQGNPVSVTVWPPSLSAEYVAGDQVSYAFVEVSRTSDFFTTLWSSGPVPTGALSAAQRTPAVSYAGPMLEPGDPYFWRIRVAQTVEGESAWSSAASSFVFLPPDPAMPAPGGFSRTSSSFGSAGYETSDLVACNWDGNNSPDIVEVTRSEPGTLTLYRNIGTSSPSPALPFGESRGGTTLAAVSDFDWNGAADIAVLDQYGLRVYVPDGAGGIELGNELSIPGFGEPVALQVTDTRWDGWLDIIVAYESCVLQIVNAEGVFESIEIMEGFENPVTDLLVTDFEPDDGLQEMWIISGGMLYLCREFGWLQQEWSLGDITRIALADGANPILPELIMAGPQELIHCTVVGDGTGAVELITNVIFSHGQQSDCIDLKGSNLDGVDAPEVVLVTAEGVTIWLRAGANYELYEYVGHPGGAGNLSVALADMNVDNFPDVVVGKSDTPHTIHFNAPRIGASIANSQATQVQFGEAFVEFQVTLDAPPVSMVEVLCETYEEESGGGGGGDGDALPDPRDFLNTQVGPLWYTPSAIWLKFTPGQLSSTFRVPLTSYYQASQWTLHVRIVKVIGGYIGQQTATASVYAMPPTSGSSGQTSGAGVSRDWQIEGEVHDIVHAGNNTYFGGDFSGITWDAQGVAALNLTGERKVKLPNLSGSVRTVAVHPDGSIYFGGLFTIDVGQSLQIKNIAKCDASGNLVTGFAPNPNDAVNAIAFDSYDRVYFGGKFTELLQTPGRVHNRLAWVYCNGQIDTTYNGSNRFGVANSYTPANAEVLVLKVAKSGFASNTEYLLVGGEKFNYALRGVSPYTYSLMLGFSYAFGNFTGFEISGSRVLTGPAFSGPVNAIEVDTSRTIGYQASHPIVIGGAYSVGKYSPTIYTSSFLTVTNFNGEYWAQQGSLTPVHALKFDEHGHLWVGRRATYSMGGTVLTEDPLSVFAWAAQGQQWSYLQQPAGPFNISSGWVESFACGTDEILAVGNFEVVENGQNVAENLAVFSTEAASLGARLNHITTTTNAWGPLRSAAACFNSGGHAGYAIVGPFSKLVIERDNLAAMDAAGHILPWAPRANAPVKAMATDGTKIYFGGAFNQVSGSPRQGVAVALANSDATSALNWTADVSGAQATVEALTLTGSHLVIGGDFMSINGVPYNDVAAVLTSGSGAAIVVNWDVNLMDGSVDQVYSLCLDGTRLFIGGSFLGISGQPSRPGLLAVSLPEAGTPQINPFDA
ncbi:MAG: VCBS repeat-containing protein, partial [Planctomycetes bacterium]|nr:VCBS repeat-containing protein [Planctomycetota bacterium]